MWSTSRAFAPFHRDAKVVASSLANGVLRKVFLVAGPVEIGVTGREAGGFDTLGHVKGSTHSQTLFVLVTAATDIVRRFHSRLHVSRAWFRAELFPFAFAESQN